MNKLRPILTSCIFSQEYFSDKINIDEAYVLELKKICNIRKRSYSNDFHYYLDRVDFKGKKLSDALNHIGDTLKNKSSIGANKFMDDIEELCEIELQNLLHELGKVNYDIYEEEQKLRVSKRNYDKVNIKFLPLNKLRNRIANYKIDNAEKGDTLQKLFDKKYFEFDLINNEFLEIRVKYLENTRTIEKLQNYDHAFKGYIEKIVDYFLTDYHFRRGN